MGTLVFVLLGSPFVAFVLRLRDPSILALSSNRNSVSSILHNATVQNHLIYAGVPATYAFGRAGNDVAFYLCGLLIVQHAGVPAKLTRPLEETPAGHEM